MLGRIQRHQRSGGRAGFGDNGAIARTRRIHRFAENFALCFSDVVLVHEVIFSC
jgi:hypothetical protein